MLELTSKYAIKALLYLARQKGEDYIQVKTIGDETGIPAAYLSKVIKILAANNLVDTRRGIMGGVRSKRKKKITFYMVCQAMEDPIIFQRCFFSRQPCNLDSPCSMHSRWSKLKGQIDRFLLASKIE